MVKRKFEECERSVDDEVSVSQKWDTSYVQKLVGKRRRTKEYREYLSPGDVIFAWRFPGYKHYGVVSEVTSNTVLVIHYYALGTKLSAVIREDPIDVFAGESGVVHTLNFANRLTALMYGKPRLAEEVVAHARRKLGKKGGKYSLLSNNCEHFAVKCKTGRSICWQSFKYKVMGGLVLISSLVYSAAIVVSVFLIV